MLAELQVELGPEVEPRRVVVVARARGVPVDRVAARGQAHQALPRERAHRDVRRRGVHVLRERQAGGPEDELPADARARRPRRRHALLGGHPVPEVDLGPVDLADRVLPALAARREVADRVPVVVLEAQSPEETQVAVELDAAVEAQVVVAQVLRRAGRVVDRVEPVAEVAAHVDEQALGDRRVAEVLASVLGVLHVEEPLQLGAGIVHRPHRRGEVRGALRGRDRGGQRRHGRREDGRATGAGIGRVSTHAREASRTAAVPAPG